MNRNALVARGRSTMSLQGLFISAWANIVDKQYSVAAGLVTFRSLSAGDTRQSAPRRGAPSCPSFKRALPTWGPYSATLCNGWIRLAQALNTGTYRKDKALLSRYQQAAYGRPGAAG